MSEECSSCSVVIRSLHESVIPKSGNRFSDKIMLKTKNLDRDPIQLNSITVQKCAYRV